MLVGTVKNLYIFSEDRKHFVTYNQYNDIRYPNRFAAICTKTGKEIYGCRRWADWPVLTPIA